MGHDEDEYDIAACRDCAIIDPHMTENGIAGSLEL